MKPVDAAAFEFAMGHITDGMLFERFGQNLLCQALGVGFVPAGGVKDRGIDGLEHCLTPAGQQHTVHQLSIEKDSERKIRRTLKALEAGVPNCRRLFYVTNQIVKDQDQLLEALFEESDVQVRIRDVRWLRGQVNKSDALIKLYLAFVDSNCHQFTQGDKALIISDLATDPRLYVFLRQQMENRARDATLDSMLADAVILYALEGTDPDKNKLRSRKEILRRIDNVLHFPVKKLENKIDLRLQALSRKSDRKINHHTKERAYCLPYTTRLKLKERQLNDAALQERFLGAAEERLRTRLSNSGTRARDAATLITEVLKRLFKQQGLEFSNYIANEEDNTSQGVEGFLSDIVSQTVEDSSIVIKNREQVRTALLGAIRETIYAGEKEEIEYLQCLATSYMMTFLLQNDPKVSTYFATMAGRLKVFVGTSILVPAISERFLEERHRRHWNLLKNAYGAGVSLLMDRGTLGELAAHIRNSIRDYKELYEGREHLFGDDMEIAYIDKILVRAFFYHRKRGFNGTFLSFINHVVTPNSTDMETELATWLKGEFGIDIFRAAKEDTPVAPKDYDDLVDALQLRKKSRHQAKNDAMTILSVYGIRERNNEQSEGSGFGYETWWLSKDSITQETIVEVLGNRYQSGCYMRPEFLNYYIALAPRPEQSDRSFDALFPTLIGVGISHHVPAGICKKVKKALRTHQEHSPARVQAMMRHLSDELKSGTPRPEEHLHHYLDEELKRMEKDRRRAANGAKKKLTHRMVGKPE